MGATNKIVLVVLVAALLQSVAQVIRRYPDPFSCHKYYIRFANNNVSHNSCPPNWYFNPFTEQCQSAIQMYPYITYIDPCPCTGIGRLEYCCMVTTFSYCAPDVFKIVDNGPCPVIPCVCPADLPCCY